MRVSTNNYRDATRLAIGLISVLYCAAGILLAISARRVVLPPSFYMLSIIAIILAANAAIFGLQKITLPKSESKLAGIVTAQDADAFLQAIIRREMARIIQPIGGFAFTIGFLAAIIALRALR